MSQKQSPNISWSPPEGYQQVPSQVSGVVVYAPKPESVEKAQAKTYKCPNCGANLAYDVSAGGIACEYCGYTAPVQSVHVGKTADEFEFTLETISQAERGWGVQRQVLHCDSCGAALSIPLGALTNTCPFCASNQVNVTTSLDETLRPRFLIPFKIKPEQIKNITADWLGKGWFHPGELRSNAALRRFNGVYLPFWTFDTQVQAQWHAQVGYKKTVRHYNSREKRWETRTKIEWRWENGSVHLSIDDYLISGSSPKHINQRILQGIYPYQISGLVAYEPDYLAGWQAQAYETTLTEAWQNAKAAIREQAKETCYEDIPTSHVRNFSMTADFADESWRYILLPVYLATYKYEGKAFQVMVN
ncbi:MAG: TFIIB-type zinc ribbon-containing protein, partial [Chloroflexota bacterium]|nr:TFIIB-type zinc ribbon-containing protein [Chloroflexota bacterium]